MGNWTGQPHRGQGCFLTHIHHGAGSDKVCPRIFSHLFACVQVVTQTSFFEKSHGHSLGYQAKLKFLSVELLPTSLILQPLWA